MKTTPYDFIPPFDLDAVAPEHRDRVEAMIPAPELADAYVHRTIDGVWDFDILAWAMTESNNVLLKGPTGSAKTTFIRAFAAYIQYPAAIIETSGQIDTGSVIGAQRQDASGMWSWHDGDLTLACRYPAIKFIDEANMAHARVTAAWHGLTDSRRRLSIYENHEVVKDQYPSLIAAAYNPGYEGTARLNEAFAQNRFGTHIEWDYDREVEAQLVDSERLLDFGWALRERPEIRTPLPTNAMMTLEKHAVAFSMEFAIERFVQRFDPAEQTIVRRTAEAHSAAIADELALV